MKWLILCLLLVSTPAAAQQYQSSKHDSDAINVLDYIPTSEHRAIRAKTSTTDVSAYITNALTAACAGSGAVFFPAGWYKVASKVATQCVGQRLMGPTWQGGTAKLLATASRYDRDPAILGIEHARVTIENLSIDGGNFDVDGVRVLDVSQTAIRGCYFANIQRRNAAFKPTANTGTDVFTFVGHGLSSGQRIEFRKSDIAGASLPSPLVANTAYYVINSATSTFQVSETLGGPAVDLTTSGSNFLGTGRIFTASVDTGTDVVTVPSHGYANGMLVEFYSSIDAPFVPTSSADDTLSSTRMFVVNATTDTFQLSRSLGGSAIDFNYGGAGTLYVAPNYVGVALGGALYATVEENTFSQAGMCIKSRYGESPFKSSPAARPYYGCNVCQFSKNTCFGNGIQLGGMNIAIANDVEAAMNIPAYAAIDGGDPAVEGRVEIRGNYVEQTEGYGPEYGVRFATSGGTLEGNVIYGYPSVPTTSRGIFSYILGQSTISNNTVQRFNSCLYIGNYSFGQPLVSAGNITGNTFANCTTYTVQDARQLTGISAPLFWYRPNVGYSFESSLTFGFRYKHDGTATALDSREATFYSYDGTHEITSITNRAPGRLFCVTGHGSGSTLDGATFGIARDYRLNTGETRCFMVDYDSNVRPLGGMAPSVDGSVLLTEQSSSVGSTALLTAPVAGAYRACAYATVTTSGAAGTLDVTLGWNDGTAARSANLVSGLSVAATNYAGSCIPVQTDGANNVTYATTKTNGAGSVYSLRLTAERLQ